MADAVLELEGVEAAYGPSRALHGVTLAARKGEVVSLLGRNGAGKSTTLKSIVGLVSVIAGAVRYEGREITGWPPHRISRLGVGYVPEDRRIFADLTVAENLEVGARDGAKPEAVYRLFPRLAELARRRAGSLSGGEQQMLTVARTLMGGPRLLLLDEPSEGLAPVIVRALGEQIAGLKREGLTILLSEQNLRFAARLADRAYIIENGLGTMVLVLPLRNPASFAKEWATLDVLSGGRSLLGVGVGWHEEEFALMGVPHRERGRRMDEMLEAVTALWTGDDVTYRGKYYRFEHLTIDPKPVQQPHPPIWIGGGTQPSEKIYAQTVANIDPVLRRVAKYARTWVPHSSSTSEMVTGDWEKIQRFMDDYGRRPEEMSKVYSNFVWVLKPGEKPETAIPHFKTYSGMDLPYWREFYLLGEAEELAEKIRAKSAALGGCEWIVLNPLDWSLEQLELLAGKVLPLVARP